MVPSEGRLDSRRARRVRQLLRPWVIREVRAHYRQSALDLGWTLVTPILVVAGYGLVLTRFFGVSGGDIPYVSFAWAGVVLWTFFASALHSGAWSLVTSADLVRKLAFPKEIVPIAAVIAVALDLVVGLLLLGVVMAIQGIGLSVTILAAVPALAGLAVFTTGCAIALATVTAFSRDLAHGLAVVLRVGIFVTPVMYPVSQIPPEYHWLVEVNPVAVFIEAFRDGVLAHRWPDWPLLGVHSLGALVLLAGAEWYLTRVEGRIADVI